jgi:lipopolysaccharide biosynthesis protein
MLSKKYLAVFAHFDQENLIDEYVVDYLRNLKEVAQEIIFVSDSDLPSEEILKINNLVSVLIVGRHGEYDFGSYKRGIIATKDKLNNYDGLIIANDSCYLISSLENVFLKMEKAKVDFWGMTQNSDKNNYPLHIQSYFMVFDKKIFQNAKFIDFFSNVKKENLKQDIIKNYEVVLTPLLLGEGFKAGCFIETAYDENPTVTEAFFDSLLPKNFPFLKVQLLKTNPNSVANIFRIADKIPKKKLLMIKKHLLRFSDNFSHWKIKSDFKLFHKKIFLISSKGNVLRIKLFGVQIFRMRLK